jgi:hypothetical protein
MVTMRGQLAAGVVPAVVLFAAFLAAMMWPRPLVADDLKFAAGVVGLQDQGVRVQSVNRWSHGPLTDGSRGVTMRTDVGIVQVLVFNTERSLERLAVVESSAVSAGSGPYRYRVSGFPDAVGELTWDSSYRWFLTVHKNWVLVTPDIAVDRIIKGMVRHQTSGRSSVAG